MLEPRSSLRVLGLMHEPPAHELSPALSTPALGDHAAYSTSTNDPSEASRCAAAATALCFDEEERE